MRPQQILGSFFSLPLAPVPHRSEPPPSFMRVLHDIQVFFGEGLLLSFHSATRAEPGETQDRGRGGGGGGGGMLILLHASVICPSTFRDGAPFLLLIARPPNTWALITWYAVSMYYINMFGLSYTRWGMDTACYSPGRGGDGGAVKRKVKNKNETQSPRVYMLIEKLIDVVRRLRARSNRTRYYRTEPNQTDLRPTQTNTNRT